MKRLLIILFALTLSLTMFMACGGGEKMVKNDKLEAYEDPFQDLQDMTNTIIEGGGVAAVGQGISKRQDLAKKKAVTDAQSQMAQIFSTKVQNMRKQFVEEIGSADDSEINEAFTDVTKTLSSTVLKGAITKKVKYMRDKETKQFTAAVVVAVEPNTVNMSIFDEMQNKKPKLYERFRASKAYDELKSEMEDYEKQQNAGY